MGDQVRKRWDKWFLDEKSFQLEINFAPWLERYSEILHGLKDRRAIDLGCGRGFDTRFLIKAGLATISADYSIGALNATRQTAPSSSLLQFDLRAHFPFADRSFGIVIANLSLHYFSSSETSEIITEIQRLLVKEGWLIARVNSTNDHGFQSVKDDDRMRIEEDYYFYNGIPRRYFRESTIQRSFTNGWNIDHIEEKILFRYEKPKALWEFAIQRTA